MQTSIYFKSTLILIFLFSTITFASGELVYAENGMVVSASEIASNVGVEILKKGGNAVDAAVATGFALAVTYPSAGNIGGGGFMVVHLADGRNTTIQFREKAPQAASQNMFLDQEGNYDTQKSLWEWTSVGVPGSVAGLTYVLEKYGTLSLEEVIQPAIDVARNGFILDYWLTQSINNYNGEFKKYPASKRIFTNNGDSLNHKQLFVQKDLAATLTLIKNQGTQAFYEGEIAEKLVEQSKLNGGLITLEDLKNYKPVESVPVIGSYKDYEILGMPLPSAGGISIVETLNAISHFDFNEDDFGSSEYIHTLTEILKYVYADRAAYLGDNKFVDVPSDYLLSEKRANEIVNSIKINATSSEEILQSNSILSEGVETTHFSVIDKDGNAVSTTVSINSSYGNRIVVKGLGFLLNNHMDDFTSKVGVKNQFGLIGSKANSIEPGKRMLSSQSPTIVLENDKPFLIIGSPGGSKIITSVLQVILNVVNFGMNIRDAIVAPRFHHQWFPDVLEFEKYGFSEDVREALKEKGYKLEKVEIIGRVQGIYFDQKADIIWGSSDKRGFGKAVGY